LKRKMKMKTMMSETPICSDMNRIAKTNNKKKAGTLRILVR
jgi:hypothetical protein